MYPTRSELLEKIRFDEQSVPGATLNDLSEPLWHRFATDRTSDTRDDLLQKLAMAHDDDGVLRPTVAGILMGTVEPRIFLPNAYIQAVAYRGTTTVPEGDAVYQLDAQDIVGPVDRQIQQAVQFVKRNMRTMARKTGGRTDVPQFDLAAVFEAVTNAAAHRDYSIYGSKIRLRLFDDRLEISSPGAIPNTMTVESMPFRQSARNEALTSLLARCPTSEDADTTHRTYIMDKRGEGVPLILERSRKLSGRTPTYRVIDDSELLLVIYSATENSASLN